MLSCIVATVISTLTIPMSVPLSKYTGLPADMSNPTGSKYGAINAVVELVLLIAAGIV